MITVCWDNTSNFLSLDIPLNFLSLDTPSKLEENLRHEIPERSICSSSFPDKNEDDKGGELRCDCFILWYVKEEVVLAEGQELIFLVRPVEQRISSSTLTSLCVSGLNICTILLLLIKTLE